MRMRSTTADVLRPLPDPSSNPWPEPERIQEICYGIAIHVDDKADFEGERTPLALSVSDADNLDRFDAYRIYQGLEFKVYSKIPLHEKRETVVSTIGKSLRSI